MASETLDKTSTGKDEHYPVRSMYNEITLTASTESGDIYRMLTVKKGMKVVDVIFTSADVDQAALNVGIDSDDNLFITVADANGGAFHIDNTVGLGHIFAADDTIDVKIGSVTTPGTVAIALELIYQQTYS